MADMNFSTVRALTVIPARFSDGETIIAIPASIDRGLVPLAEAVIFLAKHFYVDQAAMREQPIVRIDITGQGAAIFDVVEARLKRDGIRVQDFRGRLVGMTRL